MTIVIRPRILWTSLIAGGICWLWLAHAVAGPVVESTDKQTTETEESATLPDPSSATQSEEEQKKKTTRTTPAPSATTSAPAAAQPPAGTLPDLQTMPVPPTYAPGAPGGPTQTTNPYSMMPSAPTAFGPYGTPSPGTTPPGLGTPGTSLGYGGTAAPTGYGGYGMPSAGGAATGYGVPPSPTQPMSLGGAAMADPSFGRYESMSMREATGVRQPANIGEAQQTVLRQGKPFSSWRPSNAYSPYMRLNDTSVLRNPGSNLYYNYVKPLLDQQEENRVVNRNMQGLADVARAGYQSPLTVGQRPGNVAPTAAPRAPATFMNTGQYYPDPYAR